MSTARKHPPLVHGQAGPQDVIRAYPRLRPRLAWRQARIDVMSQSCVAVYLPFLLRPNRCGAFHTLSLLCSTWMHCHPIPISAFYWPLCDISFCRRLVCSMDWHTMLHGLWLVAVARARDLLLLSPPCPSLCQPQSRTMLLSSMIIHL